MIEAKKVTVVQKQGVEPVPAEIIAQSIVKIAEGWGKMQHSGLTLKAMYLLISNASGESQRTVQNVLYGIDHLKQLYLLPAKK